MFTATFKKIKNQLEINGLLVETHSKIPQRKGWTTEHDTSLKISALLKKHGEYGIKTGLKIDEKFFLYALDFDIWHEGIEQEEKIFHFNKITLLKKSLNLNSTLSPNGEHIFVLSKHEIDGLTFKNRKLVQFLGKGRQIIFEGQGRMRENFRKNDFFFINKKSDLKKLVFLLNYFDFPTLEKKKPLRKGKFLKNGLNSRTVTSTTSQIQSLKINFISPKKGCKNMVDPYLVGTNKGLFLADFYFLKLEPPKEKSIVHCNKFKTKGGFKWNFLNSIL